MFERCENTTLNASILCPAVLVTSWTWLALAAKVSYMSRANLFLLFIGEERTNMAASWEAPTGSQKVLLREAMEYPKKAGGGKYLHIFYFTKPACVHPFRSALRTESCIAVSLFIALCSGSPASVSCCESYRFKDVTFRTLVRTVSRWMTGLSSRPPPA